MALVKERPCLGLWCNSETSGLVWLGGREGGSAQLVVWRVFLGFISGFCGGLVASKCLFWGRIVVL